MALETLSYHKDIKIKHVQTNVRYFHINPFATSTQTTSGPPVIKHHHKKVIMRANNLIVIVLVDLSLKHVYVQLNSLQLFLAH